MDDVASILQRDFGLKPGGAVVWAPSGGAARSSPTKPSSTTPIFVAEKLFDEFALGHSGTSLHSSTGSSFSQGALGLGSGTGRTSMAAAATATAFKHTPVPPYASNAAGTCSSASSSPRPKPGHESAFQPSAPPFEAMVQASDRTVPLNDIFGGVRGTKIRAGSFDDVFASSFSASVSMGGSKSINATISGSRLQQMTCSNETKPEGSSQKSSSDSSDRRSAVDAASSSTSSSATSSSQQRGVFLHKQASESLPIHSDNDASKRHTLAGEYGSSSRPLSSCDSRSKKENFKATDEEAPQSSTPLKSSTQPPATAFQSNENQIPTKKSSQMGLFSKTNVSSPRASRTSSTSVKDSQQQSESHLSDTTTSQLNETAAAAASPKMKKRNIITQMGSSNGVTKKLSPQETNGEENLLSKEKVKEAPPVILSSPKKSKRVSAAERIKAVLFSGKEEKSNNSNNKINNSSSNSSSSSSSSSSKGKGWFTVGDLKLRTQPTHEPPPARPPPNAQHSNTTTNVRNRRHSSEFPAGRYDDLGDERIHLSRSSEQLASASSMKQAVERAEARFKQKREGETFISKTSSSDAKGTEKERKEGGDDGGDDDDDDGDDDDDMRAVERTSHELRERTLRKAAERAAADIAAAATLRSNSVPKQRMWDEEDKISDKKAFFSGEQVKTSVQKESSADDEKKKQARRDEQALERAAKALMERKQRETNSQKEEAEKHRLSEALDARIKNWANGKQGNLRLLLVKLQEILWSESGWTAVTMGELSTVAAIRKSYRKATLCVHPDKVQQKGATVEHKYIAAKVYDLLQEAWMKFNKEEAFFLQA